MLISEKCTAGMFTHTIGTDTPGSGRANDGKRLPLVHDFTVKEAVTNRAITQ